MARIKDDNGNVIALARMAEDLRPFISGCHYYVCDQNRQTYHDDIIFPGWFNIRFVMPDMSCSFSYDRENYFELPKMLLFGPATRLLHARPVRGTLVGFGITPIGFSRLFKLKPIDSINKVLDLETLWGKQARDIYRQLQKSSDEYEALNIIYEQFKHIVSPLKKEEKRALALFNLISHSHDENLETAADAIGISSYQLRRTAKRFFGFTPKILLRRSRFLKSILSLNSNRNESPVSQIDASYVDYSHFVKDCRYFFDMTPLDFVGLNKPMAEMSLKLMMQLTGAPLQSLQQMKSSSN